MTGPIVPRRTDEQRAAALAAAVAARQERARLRRAVRAGEITVAEVLDAAADRPEWAMVPVSWLLGCVRGLGPARTARIMQAARIAPNRRVQGLGVHQRAALRAAVAGYS